VILFCILIAYIYCYFIYPDNVTILQTSVQDFEFNLIFQRQPLVIEDTVKDVISLVNSWFKNNIIEDSIFDISKTWNLNKHKYMYIYALEDTEVLLYQAGNKVVNDVADNREPVLSITLKKYQSILIPFRWHYSLSKNHDVKIYGIHDYITYIVCNFI